MNPSNIIIETLDRMEFVSNPTNDMSSAAAVTGKMRGACFVSNPRRLRWSIAKRNNISTNRINRHAPNLQKNNQIKACVYSNSA